MANRYLAVSLSDLATCESLRWAWEEPSVQQPVGIQTMVLAFGDYADEVEADAVALAPGEEIYIHDRETWVNPAIDPQANE